MDRSEKKNRLEQAERARLADKQAGPKLEAHIAQIMKYPKGALKCTHTRRTENASQFYLRYTNAELSEFELNFFRGRCSDLRRSAVPSRPPHHRSRRRQHGRPVIGVARRPLHPGGQWRIPLVLFGF